MKVLFLSSDDMVDVDCFSHFLIVDLESTCCEDDSIPKGEHEVIEIGAVMVDATSLKEVDCFDIFVRPVRHPSLTQFCTNLTTITQKDLDKAPHFPEASEIFAQWLHRYKNYVFCSWGNYDRNHLESDSAYHNVKNPISAKHVNLKNEFAKQMKVKKVGMQRALELVNEPLMGSHHRGIDDARNICKLLPYCLI
ncbi:MULTISPECIES: 3'-5' exonuclease [unclassified Alteromonas]|uniref:3'-5' exonuclease n=1 Tax=unclassified Alteromonas TaxID=2614992 RepID=UPI00190F8526|nr:MULTISPECIES: 3'-5' exonuclease [unclassified Alteromonas]